MYKNVLRAIDGIEVYPILSFIIFFGFFIGLGIYVFTMDKDLIEKMKNKPLN